jgi:hypothetical protein
MTLIYIHGVKVRSPDHGNSLGKPFQRWVLPKIGAGGLADAYDPIYWGDAGVKFGWNLASRPKTKLLHMGGEPSFPGLGSLRGATERTPFDRPDASAASGPVLGMTTSGGSRATPSLDAVDKDRRPDFVADLYLACKSVSDSEADKFPGKSDQKPGPGKFEISALADAAATVAEQWESIVAADANDASRAATMVVKVDQLLTGNTLVGMGGAPDWVASAGEALKRAVAWPGDAIGTVLGEGRPFVNEFVAYFIGDVFVYLTQRGMKDAAGEIPQRVIRSLIKAKQRKATHGEKIVVVTHSMGSQIFLDAVNAFADGYKELDDLEIDHWFSCGCQSSLFAEMGVFVDQPKPGHDGKLAKPKHVTKWTNFYDVNDPVGYIMAPVFDGAEDIEYNTGYGLLLAHTGFLERPSFFEAMAKRL